MAESRAVEYKQKLDALIRQAKSLTPEAEEAVLALLADLSKQVLGDLARTDPSSYSGARLRALKAEIDRSMEEFETLAASAIGKVQEKAYTTAAVNVDATIAAATGGVMVHPIIDRHALGVVQGYTADLITGISRETGSKINAAIQRAYLGQADLGQLINQVGSALEDGTFTGLFGPMGNRALSIATNETMRVHSLSSQARIEDLSEHQEGIAKQWWHIPAARVPRISHLLADGQVKPAKEPFVVAGEELMYPRDPSGSAENTINCHCLELPYVDPKLLKPSDQERKLLDSLGLSVSTA
jgi:uncharacterized protein with gpF-like domain